MALEENFTPPDKKVSEFETAKRTELITWFKNIIDSSVEGLIVSGSMGYGANYSVKESSDIDMQLLVTPASVQHLTKTDLFKEKELDKAINGYLANVYSQFSLVFQKNNVNLECHFWDLKAFRNAITYRSAETKRLRSGIDTPSTDHGFSFARDESITDYYGEIIDNYPVGIFPSFRTENNTTYICRPITNMLGLPIIEKTTDELNEAFEQTWNESIVRLAEYTEDGTIDLSKFNIENTLPGKNKMRKDVLGAVRQKTKEILDNLGLSYKE